VTVSIEDRAYSYTVLSTDTTLTIRDALVALINANGDEKVVASAAGFAARMIIQAKIAGSAGNGLPISSSETGQTVTNVTTGVITTSTPTETLTTINPQLCCANVAGAAITEFNPAVPGELIIVYTTGEGLVGPQPALSSIQDGVAYNGPTLNTPNSFLNATVGTVTANVITAGLQVGAIGIYQVVLQLDGSLATNQFTQMTVAQDVYTSNIVTIPVFAPTQSGTTTSGGTVPPPPAPYPTVRKKN
jgi:uncharacterized protein (TIGR03437 family)